MSIFKGVIAYGLAAFLAGAVACGDRSSTGGVDYSGTDLAGVDIAGIDIAGYTGDVKKLDLPWNPWDLSKTDTQKSDAPPQFGTTISEVQNSDNSIKCLDGFQNYAEGFQLVDVVVTGPRYKASSSKDGYFVSETGLATAEAWKGAAITLDSAQATDFPVGTVLSMMVDHLEYYCLTEFEVVSHQDKGTAAVPAPATINPADVGSQDPNTAEKWEGVLVRVTGVEVTEAVVNGSDGKDHGMFKVTGGLIVSNDYHLTYMNPGTDQRTLGDKFDAITGIVTYSFGNYVLLPRWDSDLVPEGGLVENPPETVSEPVPDVAEGIVTDASDTGTPQDPGNQQDTGNQQDVTLTAKTVYAIQSSSASASCSAEESGKVIEAGIKVEGAVVTSTKVFVSGTIRGYYVSDPVATAAEYTGILVTFPSDWTIDLAKGDVVTVTGDHVEHFCLSEVDATAIDKTGTGAVPAAAAVAADVFASGGSAATEPWEGVLVKLTDTLTVQDATGGSKPAWWFKFKTGTASDVFISNSFDIDDNGANTPAVNDVFTSVTGFVKYSWSTYLIAPPTIGDLVKQ